MVRSVRFRAGRRRLPLPGVFAFDRRLFEDDVEGSLAWAEALARAGVLSAADAESIRDGLAAILEAERRGDPAFFEGDDEDVHAFVERKLIERVGDVGRRLHTGRSRNEQVSLDLRLYLRRRLPVMQRAVAALVDALAGRADAAGASLMPAYTHLRRAQPVLAAHFFLAHAAALRRDHAPHRGRHGRERRAAARLGGGHRHQLPGRRGGAGPAAGFLARSRQQPGRLVRPRLRFLHAARLRARDGASQPPGRGP